MLHSSHLKKRVLENSSSATMNTLVVLCAVVTLSSARPGYFAGRLVGYNTLTGHYGTPVVLTPEGVPVDTPAVQAARAAHLAAHAQIRGDTVTAPVPPGLLALSAPAGGFGYHSTSVHPGIIALGAPAGGFAYSSKSIHPAAAYYHGPAANIVLTPDGVPVDTPEVQAARAADAIAHLNAKVRNLYG